GTGERYVKALPGTVAIHGGQPNLARAERDDLPGVSHGVNPGGITAAMGKDLPAPGRRLLGVDRHDDALIAELLRRLLDEGAPVNGGGVDRHFVGARLEQGADVV